MEPQPVIRTNRSASAIADYGWEAEDEDELSFPEGAKIVDIVHYFYRRC
jgi:hypothetical protein